MDWTGGLLGWRYERSPTGPSPRVRLAVCHSNVTLPTGGRNDRAEILQRLAISRCCIRKEIGSRCQFSRVRTDPQSRSGDRKATERSVIPVSHTCGQGPGRYDCNSSGQNSSGCHTGDAHGGASKCLGLISSAGTAIGSLVASPRRQLTHCSAFSVA